MLGRIAVFIVSILFLPVLGSALGERNLALRFEFPPLSRHPFVPDYSAPVFWTYAVIALLLLGLPLWSLCCRARPIREREASGGARGGWWAWPGVLLVGTAVAIGLAEWAPAVAIFLLLTGIALVADGAYCYRRGSSLIATRPGHFLALFGAGAGLWWVLEYLNRFATAWYFVPPAPQDALGYAVLTTLAFAPVPATVVTLRLALTAIPGLLPTLGRGRHLPAVRSEGAAVLLLLVSALGLMAGPIWPAWTGVLWLAPLTLWSALQLLWGRETVFAGVFRGDWSRIVTAALAGVITGLLLAGANRLFGGGWQVAPPLLNCCALLGIPLSGYAGFALLGLLCMQLSDVVAAATPGRSRERTGKGKPFPIPVRRG